jgi:excisionase family DNA binding protein
MSDRVLVAVPGLGVLALPADTFRAALGAGTELIGGGATSRTNPPPDPLLDAEQLAEVLRVPATWIEQAAREGRIPSLQFGRWRRFRRADVEAAVLADREH